jgi:peptidylprolyl isomerase/peptidyl-prolyl cis-trans isomerase B (cyclophilin B)
MKKIMILVVALVVVSVSSMIIAKENKNIKMENQTENLKDALVDIKTSVGDIRIRLYGETPKHRDNFLKLVKEGFYEDVLFHRVINQFMIQTGDPSSKGAPAGKSLGTGGPGYDIDAEIIYPQYFHKRGALAAARQGDEVNPDRRSSGSQFYIVTGKVYNAGQLAQMEKQLQYQQMQTIFNDLAKQHRDTIMAMRRNRDQAGLQALQEELVKKTEAEAAKNPAKFTQAQIDAYTTVGGTPHLDGTYTVFGEVVEGMDVVAKIETTATGAQDRPKEDIKIISMTIVE